LYSFKGGTDGSGPYDGLVRDGAGNLYGTTYRGGAFGSGAVFKVSATGTETVLHSFAGGADGANPYAGLIRDSVGNLYGTTLHGGTSSGGIAFRLDKLGNETVLYNFGAVPTDGTEPMAGLIRDASTGNLYGTTYFGGASGAAQGTVFKLDTSGNETVLYSFSGGNDGANPSASLFRDSGGNLYGTAQGGGALGSGVVFKVDVTGTETVLHSFSGGADGGQPIAGLLRNAGNFYATNLRGGSSSGGVVFKLTAKNQEVVLHNFTGAPSDGSNSNATLIRDSLGNFYGTSEAGGAFGAGTIFKIDSAGNETILYSFTGGTDGANPYAGLIMDKSGNLYGTAQNGGAFNAGVVFKFFP
jgi:uncharacterized repeat protein (TIGR03803 family)